MKYKKTAREQHDFASQFRKTVNFHWRKKKKKASKIEDEYNPLCRKNSRCGEDQHSEHTREQYPMQTRHQKQLREVRQKSHVQRPQNFAVQGHRPSRALAEPHENATSASWSKWSPRASRRSPDAPRCKSVETSQQKTAEQERSYVHLTARRSQHATQMGSHHECWWASVQKSSLILPERVTTTTRAAPADQAPLRWHTGSTRNCLPNTDHPIALRASHCNGRTLQPAIP